MQLTTVGKLKKGSLYLKNNLSEEQPVEYDKLILYLSLKSGLLSTKNYLEDVGLDKFNTYSGINTYWVNMTQDGSFLGNPVYRVEKGTSSDGIIYKYNLSGLEKIASYGEYILTGIFKSSNSSETVYPLSQVNNGNYGLYQGGGNPWTAQNHTPGYDVIDYRFYLGNGWWRYIYLFKIDWDKISNVSYRNRFYFGFYWIWQNAGQYMWGTQPQLYIGNWKKSYQGNITSYGFSDLIKYKDSVSIEGPQTNQISISNMNSYPIGYTGNVCGFSNNFEERFGAGNWSTEIIAQDNCILPEIRKAQRITTKQNGNGGWTQGNIGNTTGDITYGVLLRLHYGEIRFGDLNSSNRLYINENYYTQRGKKLGDWIWQCGTFQASGGGRLLYQYNNTKADIQQVQIYNTNYQLSYIDGSKNSSYIELPVDVFNEFKDEMTVSFIYEPLSNKTYGEDSQIFTLDQDTTGLDWLGIYRGNNLSQQDQMLFAVKDDTRSYSSSTTISGINQRLNHKLFIQVSYKSGNYLQIYVKDLDTGDILKEENIALPSDFSFDKSFSYQRLGSLNLGTDQQNQKYSEFHFYHKSYQQNELEKLIPRVFQIDKVGFQKAKQIIEPHNILAKYGQTQFETGQFGGIWGSCQQPNCSVYIVPKHFRKNKYSYYIKRTPNITGSGSQTQNWGGLQLTFPDDNTWEEGQTYRLSFYYTGYSYNNVEVYFAYNIGWFTQDVGLSALGLNTITHSFTDEDGWQYYEQEFTIPQGYIHQTGTDGNTYYCMRQLKIGYGYTTTNEYGTRLYINDLKIEKISGNDSFRKTGGIKTRGIYAKEIFENNTFHDVYMVGTAFEYIYPDAEQRTTGNRVLKIDNNTIYNSGGRGLRLTIFDRSFNVITDTTYDVYGDDAQRTNLANQLLQIDKENYWQLTSFDQVNTNANLTNQFSVLGSTIWPLIHRSPYQAFGKGKKIIYEDGALQNAVYKTKAVLNFKV